MAQDFNPGDVVIETLTVSGDKGSADLSGMLTEASVHENVFEKGTTASVELVDTEGVVNVLRLSGGETVNFRWRSVDGPSHGGVFSLNRITYGQDTGMKSKRYVLELVSPEMIKMRTAYVSKAFEQSMGSVAQYVHSLFSSKPLYVEPTDGVRRWLAQNDKALRVIDQIRRQSTSPSNKSSTYLYYEDKDGYNFRTLEGMFSQSSIRTFFQSDAVGYFGPFAHNLRDQILAFSVETNADMVAKASLGGLTQTVKTFDLETLTYETLRDKTQAPDVGGMLTSVMRGFSQGSDGLFSFVPRDRRNPNPKQAETNLDQMSFVSGVAQIKAKLTVFGDSSLTAGKMVDAHIPSKYAVTESTKVDDLVTGPMLVVKCRHRIGQPDVRPRYCCVLETLKKGYES